MKALLSGTEMALNDCSIEFSLLDAKHKVVWCKETSVSGKEALVKMELNNPHLWDGVNDPYLYTGVVVLKRGGKEIDRREEHVGFRFYSADPDKGFFLMVSPIRYMESIIMRTVQKEHRLFVLKILNRI